MYYPSKLLLLGEYTVIKNGAALAIPYNKYKGTWSFDSPNSPQAIASRASLSEICSYIKQLTYPKLDWQALQSDIKKGLWFDSNIPTGYGLGSSGAVCAALYSSYNKNKSTDLPTLKTELAALENCFHGKSSGIDPLIAYSNSPLLVQPNGEIIKANLPTNNGKGAIFLIDTLLPRKSTPLINFFVTSAQEEQFCHVCIHPIQKSVNLAIDALLKNETPLLLNQIEIISRLQYKHLPPMLTDNTKELWQQGLETKDFFLKICGAGGGGFMLGFTTNWTTTKEKYLQRYNISKVMSI